MGVKKSGKAGVAVPMRLLSEEYYCLRFQVGTSSLRSQIVTLKKKADVVANCDHIYKLHQLFGDKLNAIIEELNETLAA